VWKEDRRKERKVGFGETTGLVYCTVVNTGLEDENNRGFWNRAMGPGRPQSLKLGHRRTIKIRGGMHQMGNGGFSDFWGRGIAYWTRWNIIAQPSAGGSSKPRHNGLSMGGP